MKKLLMSLMLIPFLASCGGQTKKEWKEISRADAIKLEAQILNNFKAPKFYSSTVEFKRGNVFSYTGEGEGFNEKEQFYKSIDMGFIDGDNPFINAYYYRVFENELWYLTSIGYEKPKEEQTRHKFKVESENPLDDLEAYILWGYYEHIYEFDCKVEEIDLGKIEGEYSLYSYDNSSLKGIVKYKEIRNDVITYDSELQIAFEKEKPSLFSLNLVSTEKPETSMYGTVTFNYSKQPTLPSDANPNDWCD